MQTGAGVNETGRFFNCKVMPCWLDASPNLQELHYVEEEQHRTKSTLQSRIKDREDEIQKLRNQVSNLIIILSQVEKKAGEICCFRGKKRLIAGSHLLYFVFLSFS